MNTKQSITHIFKYVNQSNGIIKMIDVNKPNDFN